MPGAPNGVAMLSYDCSFEWQTADIQRSAAALRAEASLLPLLRLRITELRGTDSVLDLNRNAFGLDTYAQQAAD